MRKKSTIYIPYKVESENAISGNYIYVFITDKAYTDGDARLLQYGELKHNTYASMESKYYVGNFTLDENINGIWGEDYHVYLVYLNKISANFSSADFGSAPFEITNITDYPMYGNLMYSRHDSYISIIGYDGEDSEMIIPDTIDGLPVEKIDSDVFMNCDSLKRVKLPASLEQIRDRAFEGCTNLKEIDIPESVSIIFPNAFTDCISLEKVVFHDNNGYMLSEDGESIPFRLEIMWGAFSGCSSLNELLFPQHIGYLGGYLFEGTGIEEITIPKKGIYCDQGGPFEGSEIRKIIFEDGSEEIYEGSIRNCNVEEVIIPNSVRTIQEDAFKNCDDLSNVYYTGTQAEWNAINIMNGNEALKKANIHFGYKPNTHADREKIESYISDLYDSFLGREADSSGLKAWSDALVDGKTTGAKVVYKFVYSDEFQANPLSDKDFVTAMYETVFSREPDNSGLNAWVKVLENGCTRKKVLAGFLNSDEMEELCDDMGIEAGSYHSDEIVDKNTTVTYFVSRMYRCCLGRDADFGGLTSWVSALLDGRATGTKIADGFFFSDEMKNMGLSNRDYVTNAYVALLDRQPDTNGLKAWTDALDKGADRKKIVKGFVGSQEFGNLCAEYGIAR